MAKIVSLMHASLDGYAAPPNGSLDWVTLDEITDHIAPHIAKADTGIYGKVTFGMMEAYWPSVLEKKDATPFEASHAKWYQRARKVVISHATHPDLAKAIATLRGESDKDAMIFGAPRLTQSLAALGLIDEYLLNINPVLLGGGVRVFGEMPQAKLRLVSAKTFRSGVIGAHYAKA